MVNQIKVKKLETYFPKDKNITFHKRIVSNANFEVCVYDTHLFVIDKRTKTNVHFYSSQKMEVHGKVEIETDADRELETLKELPQSPMYPFVCFEDLEKITPLLTIEGFRNQYGKISLKQE
jgi:hypothetical protein